MSAAAELRFVLNLGALGKLVVDADRLAQVLDLIASCETLHDTYAKGGHVTTLRPPTGPTMQPRDVQVMSGDDYAALRDFTKLHNKEAN